MIHSGVDGVRVRVVESREDRFPAQVDFAGVDGGKREHFIVRAKGEDAAVTDGESLSASDLVVDRPDAAVVEDYVRLDASSWEERESSEGAKSRYKRPASGEHWVWRMIQEDRDLGLPIGWGLFKPYRFETPAVGQGLGKSAFPA